jgi:hypothetical protein
VRLPQGSPSPRLPSFPPLQVVFWAKEMESPICVRESLSAWSWPRYGLPRSPLRPLVLRSGLSQSALGLLGISMGAIVPAMTAGVLISSAPENSGLASGVLNSARQVGDTIGVALLGTIHANAFSRVGIGLRAWPHRSGPVAGSRPEPPNLVVNEVGRLVWRSPVNGKAKHVVEQQRDKTCEPKQRNGSQPIGIGKT